MLTCVLMNGNHMSSWQCECGIGRLYDRFVPAATLALEWDNHDRLFHRTSLWQL